MLSAQQDSTTSFGRNAQVRCIAREALVRMHCGRRFADAMLRRARPVNKQYEQGKFVMCSVTWCARAPASEWVALARIIGFKVGIVWLQHGAVPVASALHLLRPSTTAELLPQPSSDPEHEALGADDATDKRVGRYRRTRTHRAKTRTAATPSRHCTLRPTATKMWKMTIPSQRWTNSPSLQMDHPLAVLKPPVAHEPIAKRVRLDGGHMRVDEDAKTGNLTFENITEVQ